MGEFVRRGFVDNSGENLGYEPRAKVYAGRLTPLRLVAGEMTILGSAAMVYAVSFWSSWWDGLSRAIGV